MKSYVTLVKKLKQEIDTKQKEVEVARSERLDLKQQLELLLESLEKEKLFVDNKRFFVNTGYFERISKKISAYTHMVSTKDKEIELLTDDLLELFRERKKYELLIERAKQNRQFEEMKRVDFELQDIFQGSRSSYDKTLK